MTGVTIGQKSSCEVDCEDSADCEEHKNCE